MPLQMRFKIDAFPFITWSFVCPNCNKHVPVFTDSKGRVECSHCHYKYFKESFNKTQENIVNQIKAATGAKVIDF
mgnify:CR=1 FL=1